MASLTKIVVFALGMGFNAALFLLISSVSRAPLPGVPADESLVRIRGIQRRGSVNVGREFSYPEYREYASQDRLFASVAAWTSADVVLGIDNGADGTPTLLSGAATYVTANYFDVLGVRPIRGSGLPTGHADLSRDSPLVAVLSYTVWDRCFGLADDVVGRRLKVNDIDVTIVGVAPRRFAGARTGGSAMRVWLPLGTRDVVQRAPIDYISYDPAFLGLAARLQSGVDITETQSTVAAIGARSVPHLHTAPSAPTRSTDVVPMLAGNYFPPSGEAPDVMGRVTTLMIPVLILLDTCTNVSTLLAGQALARRREIGVRLALGASRRRVVRQLITESVLLATTAAALALLVIWILLRFVEISFVDATPAIDWLSVVFTLVVALVAGVIFGLSPALHGTRVPVSDVLKDSTAVIAGRPSRLQPALVVAQIALTQPLLLGMTTLILDLANDLRKVPSPVQADRVVDVRFNTNPRYGSLDEARESTLLRLREKLGTLPGVVAIVAQENDDDYFPAAVHGGDLVDGGTARTRVVRAQAAPPGYFELMGIPVVRGRTFDSGQEDRGAIIIGATAASRLWPSADPIGRRLVSSGSTSRGSVFTVVGVVDEAAGGVRTADDEIRVFVPDVRVTGHFLMRTAVPAQPMLPAIRAAAIAEAPHLPLVSVRTLDAIESTQRASLTRALAAIVGTGFVALFISAIGLYAVVAFSVRQRVHEIGIRTSLGAAPRDIVGWFLLRGLRLSALGIGIGIALSVVVVRLIVALKGGEHPPELLGVAGVVGAVAVAVTLLATWIPARRAAAVDPLLALRER